MEGAYKHIDSRRQDKKSGAIVGEKRTLMFEGFWYY